MADELPSDYDAIILGTGMPESIVAAALARIGYKVLHLDRNDYYSGYWACLGFESLQKWIETARNHKLEKQVFEVCDKAVEEIIYVPSDGKVIHNVEVQSFLSSSNQNTGNDNKAKEITNEVADDTSKVTDNTNEVKDNSNKVTGHEENASGKVDEVLCDGAVGFTNNPEESAIVSSAKENNVEKASFITNEEDVMNKKDDIHDCIEDTKNEQCEDDLFNEEKTKVKQYSENSCADVISGYEDKQVSESKVIDNDLDSSKDALDFCAGETEKSSKEHSNDIGRVGQRHMRKEKNLNENSTYAELVEKSRKFNLDLSPKILFARGLLVETLINANISHYAEFKIISRILTKTDEGIEEVPCSRSDVFSSKLINVLEKRALMRFMTFCLNYEDHNDQYEPYVSKPFKEFLISRKLSENLQHIILHSIAGVAENALTLCGLKATQKFLKSLGRYGNSPFLWSLYGTGELPQAFCRMCAVFGGIYCLRKSVKSLVLDENKKKCVAVISDDGQRLNTKWLIMERSYAPGCFNITSSSTISRAILITNKSLKPAEQESISLLTMSNDSNPLRIIELPPSSMASPQSLYVVHLTTETVLDAIQDLRPYVNDLFQTRAGGVNNVEEKPFVLWSLYFNMETGVSSTDTIPSNVRITSLPSVQPDFEDAINEAKKIFSSICPDEDFLPAVPNPEDIIWDNIGCSPFEESEVKDGINSGKKDRQMSDENDCEKSIDNECNTSEKDFGTSEEKIYEDS